MLLQVHQICTTIAKGYSQQKGVDYEEIFSPVVRHTFIRAVLAMKQMDVKTDFLRSDLEEQIYMEKLEGLKQLRQEHLV